MPKKLTKDQKYNRKRRKDGNKDFRRVPKEGDFDGVRVTRKQITFYISDEAAERLQQMADDAGIFKWEMASRMILKGLPGIQSSGYASRRNPEAINRYEWNVLYLEPVIKKIHYRSGKADKRVTMDITSTAWNKIHCHSTVTERSMSQIFQWLCLNYKPYEAPYKFLDVGSDVIHVKGIPVEYWDDAEFEEYSELMEKKFNKLNRRWDEWQKRNDELFEKLQLSTYESEE